MTKEEAIEVLQTMNDMYPKFNLTKRKAKVLIPGLMKVHYEGVMHNLSEYVLEHPFPPMLSEIAAYEEAQDAHVEEWKRWQEEAKKVRPEMKEQFQVLFDKFVEEKSWD